MMVRVEFSRSRYGYESMDLDGHAEFNPGNDVVCAGISALAYALAGELKRRGVPFRNFNLGHGVHVETEPHIEPDEQRPIDAVYETCLTGLRQIEKKYPEHVRITEVTL